MAKVSIILDKRSTDDFGRNPIKLLVCSNKSNTTVSTNLYIHARDFIGECERAVARTCVEARRINKVVMDMYLEYMSAISELDRSGRINAMTASDIRDYVKKGKEFTSERTFTSCMEEYSAACRAYKTQQAYEYTLQMMERYKGKKKFMFEEIDFQFLTEFERWMENNKIGMSSRSIIFRNMRTVYNYAINNDWVNIQSYPFRKFKIKKSRKEKEHLSLKDMRALVNIPLKGEERTARDFFLLSFYLCGINPCDLYNLSKPDKDNNISFTRQKLSHNEPLPIRLHVPDRALQIIDTYASDVSMLSFSETHHLYDTFKRRMNTRIASVGKKIGCDNLYFYMARYTWATFADTIGVPHDVISKALGHSDKSTAERYYIEFNWERVWKAQEDVIDYLCKDM